MTSLAVLDLSHNVLTDRIIMDGERFGVLPNLTVFGLGSNRFSDLPIDLLIQHTKLKVLDVSYNRLDTFYPRLTEQIKRGMDALFEGERHVIQDTALPYCTINLSSLQAIL